MRIAASIAVHDGSAAQAADLFRWLGPVSGRLCQRRGRHRLDRRGRPAQAARAALSTESAGPPTSTARAARSLAEGLLLSLDQPFPVAIARLGQSITAEQHRPGVAPDTPAALVTLAALHGGDPVRARSVIGRAVRAGWRQDDAFSSHRHRLLLGWVRMQDGQLAAATADVAAPSVSRRCTAATPCGRRRCTLRSRGAAVTAVRCKSIGTPRWKCSPNTPIDLFSLLPLGELWVAAARMRQVDRLQHTLDEALALLESLGNPVLWSVPLHWAGVHAGILANSPEAVAPHGQALTSAAGGSPFAKALSNAGRTWLRVLANHVDADEVTAAARSLSQFGLTWDATRLAGQAALQTPDGRVSGAMLQLARDLKQTMAVDEAGLRVGGLRRPWPRVRRGRSRRGCRTESARSPNCCCSACRTAISAAGCSSPRRPSSTTSRAFAAGWGRSRARRCSPCCERCWPRRADRHPDPLTRPDPLIEFP